MPKLQQTDFVFPLVAGKVRPEGGLDLKTLVGTCFYTGKGTFITAGHVMQTAMEYSTFGVARTAYSGWISHIIPKGNVEIVEDIDIALFRLDSMEGFEPKVIEWGTDVLSTFDPVMTFGFPFGLVGTNIVHRGLKGSVVGYGVNWDKLPSKPKVYELSFSCPKGISGSLLINDTQHHRPCVYGVVIANQQYHLESDSEIEEDGDNHYEIRFTTKWGIALRSKELLDMHFNMLDGSLRSFLGKQNALSIQGKSSSYQVASMNPDALSRLLQKMDLRLTTIMVLLAIIVIWLITLTFF